MRDFDSLPADEQQVVTDEALRRYRDGEGEDIDRAIMRHRKTLAQHDRELDHVATLDFEKPYRWRIAPSVALRAEKALERQHKRRAELYGEIVEQVMRERGHAKAQRAEAPPSEETVKELSVQFEQAMKELQDWKLEGKEASPPVTSAA